MQGMVGEMQGIYLHNCRGRKMQGTERVQYKWEWKIVNTYGTANELIKYLLIIHLLILKTC